MTATDELRRMLDERGESWHKWPDEDSTTWQAYSDPHTATESMDGTLIVTGLTPEQAVIATLEVDQLQAENARFKQELEAVGTAAYLYGRNDLADENAKLRELCAALYEFAYDEYPDSAELNFASSMRELGVEVDA